MTEYRDFVITTRQEDGGWVARVARKDNRRFTIKSTVPHMLFGWADTMANYPTEAEAIEHGKTIVDAAQPFGK